MSEQLCIFVVDDDPLQRMVISDQLAVNPRFRLHEFASGEECLAAFDFQPDLVLLDIEMPGWGGLETCRKLREHGHDDVHILFFTNHDDLDSLLAAYKAGGNDFVAKNVSKDVLLRKIELIMDSRQQQSQLKNQLSFANQTAFTAMSNLGETGNILHFLRSTFDCRNLKELGKLVIDTVVQFGVKGIAKVDDGVGGVYSASSLGDCDSLEDAILGYAAKLERIHFKQDRLVFNYPHVTMLVIGMEEFDSDYIGRIRDHLAIIAEGCGVRIKSMLAEQLRARDAANRLADARDLTDLLGKIEENQTYSQTILENLTDKFQTDIDAVFVNLGLTDRQEQRLHDIINQFIGELIQRLEVDNRLAISLSAVVEKQKKLLAAGAD